MAAMRYAGLFLMAFFLGYLVNYASAFVAPNLERPFGLGISTHEAPTDRILKEQIKVYDDKVILDVRGAEWAEFTATGSMKPLFDEHANAIELIPKQASDLHVGDVVSYERPGQGVIIHRIVAIGADEQGWFATMKGDNNPVSDPGKVRWSQIRRVVIAIVY